MLLVEVELHIDADEGASVAERLIEKALDVLLHALLHLAGHLELRYGLLVDSLLVFLLVGVVQYLAGIVHDGDIFRREALDTVRRQIDDALDLFLGELLLEFQLQHDGCRRRFLVLLVEAVLGEHDMDPGPIDRRDLLDSTRQLSLERLQVIDFVLKLGDPELAVIEYLEALMAPGESLRRQIETSLMDILRRN